MKKTAAFLAKRIYDAPEEADGLRVLVDRLWPRGITKEKAVVHLWLKDVTPSSELRQWIHHDPTQWDEFRRRYFAELDQHPDAVQQLRDAAGEQTVTLLSAVKDLARSHVSVLLEYLHR